MRADGPTSSVARRHWLAGPRERGHPPREIRGTAMAALDQLEQAALVGDDSVAVPAVATAVVPQQLASRSDADGTQQPAAGLHWTVLPQLFAPNHTVMRKQSAAGCAVVSGTILACVCATHAAVSFGELSDPLPTVFIAAIWAETTVALVCLFGLLFGDPGVIKRSEQRCTPVPSGLIRTTLVRLHFAARSSHHSRPRRPHHTNTRSLLSCAAGWQDTRIRGDQGQLHRRSSWHVLRAVFGVAAERREGAPLLHVPTLRP